jgi:carboxyl-terminal processing protease
MRLSQLFGLSRSSSGDPENRPERTRRAALISLSLIITFAAGDFLGNARHRSPVDQSISQVAMRDPKSPSKDVLERAAIEAVLKATGDQWANYFPAKSVPILQDALAGRYSGVGIWLWKNSSGVLEVATVQPSSPAAIAGIHVLDVVSEIDGVAMDGASLATAIAALRGPANSIVNLQLERGNKTFSAQIKRASVLTGDVVANQIAPHVIYVQVSAISSHSADDVKQALAKYPHSKGIILDLRDNPGGLIDEAVNLASLFLSEGTVVSYSRQNNSDEVLNSNNTNPDVAPMVVLINRSTASSAEVITGALQDRNRAVVLGEKSYGKGTVQEIFNLYGGSQLEITVGKYRTPSGHIIDQVGITPDLLVNDKNEISTALSVLQGLASFNGGKLEGSKS